MKMKAELRLVESEAAARLATASVETLLAVLKEVDGRPLVLMTPNLYRVDLVQVLKLALTEQARWKTDLAPGLAEGADTESLPALPGLETTVGDAESQPAGSMVFPIHGARVKSEFTSAVAGWVVGKTAKYPDTAITIHGVQASRAAAIAMCPPGNAAWFVVPIEQGQVLVVGEDWPGLCYPAAPGKDAATEYTVFCPTCQAVRRLYRAGDSGTAKAGSLCCAHCQRIIMGAALPGPDGITVTLKTEGQVEVVKGQEGTMAVIRDGEKAAD